MQVKCEYCGAYISDSDEFCSQCGAVNPNFKRSVDGTPKTISELKAWYSSKNLPSPEVTRFFIGVNHTGPRAFGIYEDNGEFIVYKNKDDGSRAIRYQGRDEAYAVNEIYLKLKSEILNQKAHNLNNNSGKSGKSKSSINTLLGSIFIIGILLSLVTTLSSTIKERRDLPYVGNYYYYDDNLYYCESYVDNEWYLYDEDDQDYLPVSIPEEMYNNIQDYKYEDYEEWDSTVEYFEDTPTGEYVTSTHESSYSSDSDYSWDSSDSWDSDSSDWGSDW